MNTAIVMGVGPLPGLGAHLARRFARRGLNVFVAGRSADKLDAVAAAIRAEGGTATAVVADTTDEAAVNQVFARAVGAGRLECALYNAGNNTPGRIVDMAADYFEQSWRIGCFGGFLFGRAALRAMLPHQAGTILYTGASASLRGRPNFGAFASAKGALRAFAQSLAKEAGPLGIHVGHVIVDGVIDGEKIRTRAPDYVATLTEADMIALDAIADGFEFLHDQPSRGWSFELDLRTAKETW